MTGRTRNLAVIAVVIIAAIATVALCWPRSRGYTYQGKTVEEWFEEYRKEFVEWVASVRTHSPSASVPPGQASLDAFRAITYPLDFGVPTGLIQLISLP